jgi:hypothetical protein
MDSITKGGLELNAIITTRPRLTDHCIQQRLRYSIVQQNASRWTLDRTATATATVTVTVTVTRVTESSVVPTAS